jgi:hypothetical protein
MVANLNTVIIYTRILTLKNVGTAVYYHHIFITLALGFKPKIASFTSVFGPYKV